MSNPFSGPFAGAPGVGGNPLDDERNVVGGCPRCKSTDYRAWTMQYGLMKHCNACGEEWSGGSVAVAIPDFIDQIPPPGVAAPEDLPVVQYTGAEFRNPDKTYDGGDY